MRAQEPVALAGDGGNGGGGDPRGQRAGKAARRASNANQPWAGHRGFAIFFSRVLFAIFEARITTLI